MHIVKEAGFPIFVKLIFWLIGIGILGKLGFNPLINYMACIIGKIVGNLLFAFKFLVDKIYKRIRSL